MKKKFETSLALKESYTDSLENYQMVLQNRTKFWDYIILTASNETQADVYRKQIEYRKNNKMLPTSVKFLVIADPEGKRVGSGGATLNCIKQMFEIEEDVSNKRILVIHSGGDSKRVPQYSFCGKLFSPVLREVNNRSSSLFDEIMIGLSILATKVPAGMTVCSGDVLVLFNALQADFYSNSAVAISIKEDVDHGQNHGVFLKDDDGKLLKFLHKKTAKYLNEVGAVDVKGNVDIDTGIVVLNHNLIKDLYNLIKDEPHKFINDKSRLSFYADFIYPLAKDSTLDNYYKEKSDGEFTDELKYCRGLLWGVLRKHTMGVVSFAPALFIHFGTTKELLNLQTIDFSKYKYLNWKKSINSNVTNSDYSVLNSYVDEHTSVGKNCFIEDCMLEGANQIGENCVLSNVWLENDVVPSNVVLHGLKLKNGKYVVRMYNVQDNPKENVWMSKMLDRPLWNANLFPECNSLKEAVKKTLAMHNTEKKTSLMESFNNAEANFLFEWKDFLANTINEKKFIDLVKKNQITQIDSIHLDNKTLTNLKNYAQKLDGSVLEEYSIKIRLYYALYKYLSKKEDCCDEAVECYTNCFKSVAYTNQYLEKHFFKEFDRLRLKKNCIKVELPIRINFAGGWSDTAPYCFENGGTVLNAAVLLNDSRPIIATIEKLNDNKIILESIDVGCYKEFTTIDELNISKDVLDMLALHKAALLACGIIKSGQTETLEDVCKRLGGGIKLTTKVQNIPKGSGLGTSSILAAACIKAIYQICDVKVTNSQICSRVLVAEQLMSTGGGWQDQIGAIYSGIKLVKTEKGLKQDFNVEKLNLSQDTIKELNSRLCLIYTGQRRLARNLLREVVGNYLCNENKTIEALNKIQSIAIQIKNALLNGDIDGFASLLNTHWELSQQIDKGCTNECIEKIFARIKHLTDGKMICGAGGGGFLYVILKKDVTKEDVARELDSAFEGGGIKVWAVNIDFN